MKKELLIGFLMAVVLMIGTAATTVSVMTVKPAIPKHVIVHSFMYYRYNEMNSFINSNISKGYTLKSVYGAGSNSIWFVVMEKH